MKIRLFCLQISFKYPGAALRNILRDFNNFVPIILSNKTHILALKNKHYCLNTGFKSTCQRVRYNITENQYQGTFMPKMLYCDTSLPCTLAAYIATWMSKQTYVLERECSYRKMLYCVPRYLAPSPLTSLHGCKKKRCFRT